MSSRRLSVAAVKAAATGLALAVTSAATIPASADAHGLSARADLPLPGWLFGWAAAIVLTLSFVGLGALWQSAKFEPIERRVLLTVPRWVDPLCGAIGVALFCGLVYTGFAGTSNPVENALPTFVYVVFWVGLPLSSAVLGNLFGPFNPWRRIADAFVWIHRGFGLRVSSPLRYPERLGQWPAVVGLVAFGWLELVANHRDSPALLAKLAIGYATIQLLGMALFGRQQWSRNADAFGAYFRILSLISPFGRDRREIVLRPLLSGLTQIEWRAGTVGLLCSALGITAFDGASSGELWLAGASAGQKLLSGMGIPETAAIQLISTIGLISMILLVTGVYWLGVEGMRSVDPHRSPTELRRLFAHSLVPISVVYVIAHYFSMLVFQGQALAYLVSDPLGHGSDLFGTAQISIDYGLISAVSVWYLQVAALVVGHICGLVLAHDKALVLYGHAKEAIRSQYWMLVVMVGFTSLGLWLLSQANA